ncbi:DUF6036 family nucleotidyltransferase [Victivallis sp. Marseille-Q1083]|uniref:DUF6036 family nucleotidyltransferase n=1 Tax=Victivallis sp. Marseille-Q1083 TaxID=2717288 RepID=UPI00158EBF89|nr:DUF6036 family nucleotidyltransferase [Victivallis sp. Marseille-Q1083]
MNNINKSIDGSKLAEALNLLNERLILDDAPHTELVVCGGSALIATGLVPRTTRDIDIIALMDADELKESEPLPEYLIRAADIVGHSLELPVDWLNNGPASQFRMGLPEGFQTRLSTVVIGKQLTMHYISRYDQIFFKTYASADRGGYHVSDLRALTPSEEELIAAAKWCMTQDVSPEFREILKSMFFQLGWKNVSGRI